MVVLVIRPILTELVLGLGRVCVFGPRPWVSRVAVGVAGFGASIIMTSSSDGGLVSRRSAFSLIILVKIELGPVP